MHGCVRESQEVLRNKQDRFLQEGGQLSFRRQQVWKTSSEPLGFVRENAGILHSHRRSPPHGGNLEVGRPVLLSGKKAEPARKKRARDSLNQGGSEYKRNKHEEADHECYVCGRTNHHPDRCKLKDHPHANKNKDVAWKDSKWGNIYASKLPYQSLVLNARHVAVEDADGNYTLEKREKSASTDRNDDRDNRRKSDDRRDRHNKSDRKSNYGVSQTATTNLNNFVTGKSTFNPLISARSVNTETILGTGILDSGAFGGHINNYVNQAMVDSLIASGDITSTCACHSTKICTLTGCVSSSTCVKLKIQLFNNLGHKLPSTQ